MKKLPGLLLFLVLFIVSNGIAQKNLRPDSPEYEKLKSLGKLTNKMVKTEDKNDPIIDPNFLRNQNTGPNQTNSIRAQCNCLVPVDSSFSVVPFTNGTPPDYRNDDGFTTAIALPFSFNFYGAVYNSVFINNNGNITFDRGVFAFSAGGFPAGMDTFMIAPFWGDVDTRLPTGGGYAGGIVHYKLTSTYMIVQWDSVGYYGIVAHHDKSNTFQLIITDGFDPILPPGNNVDFCYGDMGWTTGDASFGIGGFGGTPATVGANAGNGVDFIQFGRFDQAGTAYDGPFGANDGVDFLDFQNFIFNTNTTGGSANIPPIIHGLIVCDTITICSTNTIFADTIPINLDFLSPEQNQITTITTSFTGSGIFNVINNTPGPIAHLDAELILNSQSIGLNTVTIYATDDYNPPGVDSISIIFKLDTFPLTIPVLTGPHFYCDVPNPTGVTLVAPSGYINYLWSNGIISGNSLQVFAGTYNVELTDIHGCKAKTDAFPVWAVMPNPIIGGITAFCGTDSAHLHTTQPFVHYQWLESGNPTGDTTATLNLGTANSGIYSVTVTDSTGCTATSPTLNVVLHSNPQALFSFFPVTVLGGDTVYFFDQSVAGSGTIIGWLWNFGDSTNSTSTLQNPYHIYDSTGTYTVSLTVFQSDSCSNTFSTSYIVESDNVIPPNVFTPNGDNFNDVFKIKNLEFFPNTKLQVFSRWGRKVYENASYDNKWNGGDLSEGVYYYILNIPERDVMKGTVTIKR